MGEQEGYRREKAPRKRVSSTLCRHHINVLLHVTMTPNSLKNTFLNHQLDKHHQIFITYELLYFQDVIAEYSSTERHKPNSTPIILRVKIYYFDI